MQPSPLAGHVKALGWQKLECPLHAIQQAITSALLHLGMPFVSTVVAGVEDCSFVVLPPQPSRAAPTTEEVVWQCFDDDPMKDGDMLQMAPPSPDLRVSILIFVASPSPEGQEKQKHDVRIRRTQGGQWRFQAFYAAFRKEFASRLGMPDERQLSLHSPLQHINAWRSSQRHVMAGRAKGRPVWQFHRQRRARSMRWSRRGDSREPRTWA